MIPVKQIKEINGKKARSLLNSIEKTLLADFEKIRG
jgi:hypothetical protein